MATKSIASVTLAQREQCVSAISSAAREGATLALEDLAKTDSLGDLDTFQKEVVERQGELNALVRETICDLVKCKIADMLQFVVGILKLVSAGEEIEVPATDGTETIANARSVFTWGIDNDFQRWGTNVPGRPTKKTKAQVYELAEDGDFRTIFSVPGRDFDSLAWEQAQVIAFVRKHKKWLRTDGYATFLLFKVDKEGEETQFFVADVYLFSDGGPCVRVYHFSDDFVWFAGCRPRLVIPQQTLES